MNNKYKKINLTRITVIKLLEKITSSNIKPGDAFATEKQLEIELNVSRSIIREAVNQLKALGLLESRQRVGLVISSPDPVKLLELSLNPFLLNNMDLKELAELRYTLEIGAVELAVKRASEKQINKLIEYAEEYAKAVSLFRSETNNHRDEDEIERDFHGMILKMTNNTLLERMMGVLNSFFSRIEKEINSWGTTKLNDQSAWEHRAIAKAFIDRNANRARAILEEHLSTLINRD